MNFRYDPLYLSMIGDKVVNRAHFKAAFYVNNSKVSGRVSIPFLSNPSKQGLEVPGLSWLEHDPA